MDRDLLYSNRMIFAKLIEEQALGHARVYGSRTIHDLGRRLHRRRVGCNCRLRRCPETGRGDGFGFCRRWPEQQLSKYADILDRAVARDALVVSKTGGRNVEYQPAGLLL